ncbi:tripartite tricarboxylate transporter permease [Roseovarius sp. EGI FJ00037]|uniref:tripartite tricarboxylate transporter permease n=1 Tax=Roseovarius salincola TaxID=2978479 RepID=UPI0022A84FCE|nr:tripartite tricarboxylate transporter permease [Roseovarius sp. EGI FJ00037]MCZ0813328.1 tripartite tricarboxylate transporter permease [Roseovarius sp. EGI FJ00037]
MENFIGGATALFTDPTGLLIFIGGLLGGMLFGSIPGINMLTLGAVILPFTAGMTAEHAIMLYSVIYCSGVFGGAITAILFNIPGSPENAPTTFDGYPMTLKGEASRAIGAAVICSALGGVVSAVLMMSATPLIAGIAVSAFGPPEVFALIAFGLCVAASVGAETLWKGTLSVFLGMLIATVGTDPESAEARFAFGSYYLLAGIGFVPLILGFFAISEIFVQAGQIVSGTRAKISAEVKFPSIWEFWRMRFTVIRSVLIGFFAGVLPGIGATLAAFLSYGEAIRWSKDKSKFGKGEISGVVASETANNSATGAAMIPLLALGLPGGALTAMMMGVFEIHGMEVGPLVFITSSDLIWIVFAAMFFANVCILALGWIQTKTVVHLLRIPFRRLAPAILLIAIVGAYAGRNSVLDVWVMLIAGGAGFLLRRTGYSVAGIVLGVILGGLGESVFVKTMQIVNYDLIALMQRPIVALLLIAASITLALNILREVSPPKPDFAERQSK